MTRDTKMPSLYQIGITKSGYQDGLPRNYIKTPTICLVRIDIELRFQVRVYKTQYQDAIQDTKAGYQYGYQVEIQRRHQDTKMYGLPRLDTTTPSLGRLFSDLP